MSGLYVVSIRSGIDHDQALVDARTLIDRGVQGVDLATLPFGQAGHTRDDLETLLAHLHDLATGSTGSADPAGSGSRDLSVSAFTRPMKGMATSDSEDRPTEVFLGGLGGATGLPDWLACAEALHITWPHLLDTLGISVSGVCVGPDSPGEMHTFSVPPTRVPKRLRLCANWDYDADGGQVSLDPLEAAQRLADHETQRATAARG